MSIAQLAQAINKTAFLRTEGFEFQVIIRDVKMSYGNVRYLVAPTYGTGEAWVDESRISKIGQEL